MRQRTSSAGKTLALQCAFDALKEFILPGGTRAASLCTSHACLSPCERCVVRLYRAETAVPYHVRYLNRLSDFLFVLCRVLNRQNGVEDVMWQPRKNFGSNIL